MSFSPSLFPELRIIFLQQDLEKKEKEIEKLKKELSEKGLRLGRRLGGYASHAKKK